MKKTLLLVIACALFGMMQAKTVSYKRMLSTMKKTMHASFDRSTDKKQLAEQYSKNTEAWDAVIEWISTHDVKTLPAGTYYAHMANGDSVLIKIQDATTRGFSRIEGHREKIDFQWTIEGTEVYHVMGMQQVSDSTEYNAKKDVQYFNLKSGEEQVLTSTPDKVYVFFPSDPHRALLYADEPKPIRKVVAKIPFY